MQELKHPTEFEIIRRYLTTPNLSFPRDGIQLGIGDDAALIEVPPDKLLAMSMDVLVADVHFPSDADPALIAHRALAVNLSDLAAMAAEPFCFTLGLVLPSSDADWLRRFSYGLEALAKQHNCPLVGGDTSSGPLSISIQVQGLLERTARSKRSGAEVGDRVYVSGALGDGATALLTLGLDSHLGDEFSLNVDQPSEECKKHFEDTYFRPVPRIEFALAARELFTSCIDISDGLDGDLQHILESSEVAARINIASLPFSDSALCCLNSENRLRAALFGGDDYELCFTVANEAVAELERLAAELGVRLSCIGEIVDGNEICYIDDDGAEVDMQAVAFQHFDVR